MSCQVHIPFKWMYAQGLCVPTKLLNPLCALEYSTFASPWPYFPSAGFCCVFFAAIKMVRSVSLVAGWVQCWLQQRYLHKLYATCTYTSGSASRSENGLHFLLFAQRSKRYYVKNCSARKLAQKILEHLSYSSITPSFNILLQCIWYCGIFAPRFLCE